MQARLDVPRLDHASQRLLPLVYVNLIRQGLPPGRLAALGDLYRATWLWNQSSLQWTRELVQALAREDIPSIVLKGLALAMTYYRDMGARPMGDVDLLVPAALAGRAAGVLRRSGWTPRYPLTPAFVSVKHAAPFDGEDGAECDLHWRVFEEAGPASADDDWWAASSVVEFQGTRFGVLGATDQLLHVCIHGAKWTWLPTVRWVADAVLIVRAGGIDWPRLVAQAQARRFTLRLRETLGYLATDMGAAIPPETLAGLSRVPSSPLERFEHWVTRREHRLLGELPTYWCNYLRARPGGLLRPLGFARYLQRAWELESVGHVPGRALRLVAHRLSASTSRPSRRRLPS